MTGAAPLPPLRRFVARIVRAATPGGVAAVCLALAASLACGGGGPPSGVTPTVVAGVATRPQSTASPAETPPTAAATPNPSPSPATASATATQLPAATSTPSPPPPTATPALPVAATVDVLDSNHFVPANVTIAAGGTVTWIWEGNGLHDLTSAQFPSDPAGAKFTGQYSFRFAQAGTYNYSCAVHEYLGMRGTVVVR